jgi:serine/threonine protein kinase
LRRSKNLASYFSNKNGSIYDFSLLKNLGEGKFGTVVQAMHRATNSIYAIKKILKKNIKNNAMIDQLIKEIKLQSYCSH